MNGAALCVHGHPARLRFRFGGGEGLPAERCLRHAVLYRPVLRTSTLTALVVGSILTAINQGNVLLAGEFPAELAWKVPLTYSVPFMVSTWAALRVSMVRG